MESLISGLAPMKMYNHRCTPFFAATDSGRYTEF